MSDTVKRMGWTKSLIGSCMSWIFLFLIVGNNVQIGHNEVRTCMYKEGDIYVVELAILCRTLFVCSHASEFTFSSETYLELLKLAEHDL